MKNAQSKKDVTPVKKINRNTSNAGSNSNILLNHNNIPVYNNINIYANMNKDNELNLRHYIFNKMGNNNKVAKQQEKSIRSNSYIGHM